MLGDRQLVAAHLLALIWLLYLSRYYVSPRKLAAAFLVADSNHYSFSYPRMLEKYEFKLRWSDLKGPHFDEFLCEPLRLEILALWKAMY